MGGFIILAVVQEKLQIESYVLAPFDVQIPAIEMLHSFLQNVDYGWHPIAGGENRLVSR